MTNNAPTPITPGDTPRYSKEIQAQKLILEIEQVFESLVITVINNKKVVPVLFVSELSLEEIKNKDESLSLFKSLNNIYNFFTKLIEKDKFKIEEKDGFYTLTFCYEEKMEDKEIEFDILKKEIDVKEENKNIANYINEIKDDVDNLKKLSSLIIDEEEEAEPSFTKTIKDKKLDIHLIKQNNLLWIKVDDNSKIVTYGYFLNLPLEKINQLNKNIDNYDKLFSFFKTIFDKNKFEIKKNSNDSYILKIYFKNGIDENEQELELSIPREKINHFNENKKIHKKLENLQSQIDEQNINFQSKIRTLERFNDQITDKIKKECSKYFLDLCWPIGSYYWTNNETSPEQLFGGNWTKIEGKFVYAADGNRRINTTGGQERVTLSVNEINSKS